MNRVHLEEQRALLPQILVPVLEVDTFLPQRDSCPHAVHARPEIKKDHLFRHCFCDRSKLTEVGLILCRESGRVKLFIKTKDRQRGRDRVEERKAKRGR